MRRAVLLFLALASFLLGGCSSQQAAVQGENAIYGNKSVSIDATDASQGYMKVKYLGENAKVKLQVGTPDGDLYTYLLSHEGYEIFPFSSGDGTYSLRVLENAGGDMYAVAYYQELEVKIVDEFSPFLHPNQYVSYTQESEVVARGTELAQGAESELDIVKAVYHFVIENISYDEEKAESVGYGYVSDVDEVLRSGKGICTDYAAVMTAMLRSQGIPTKFQVGYAREVYHAWVSVYIDEIGWIDNLISFDGSSWTLLDPTFAVSLGEKELSMLLGYSQNYKLKYTY